MKNNQAEEKLWAGLPVKLGDRIAGKYLIEELIAAGGQGVVLRARHEVLGRDVAIKLMLPEALGDVEAAQRFLREARAAARIESDYVTRVTDVDVIDGNIPFMVMELLKGSDLSKVIDDTNSTNVVEAVDYVMEALAGVDAAHKLGVVHRDLKPSNLFLATLPDGTQRVRLLDFGISKVMEGSADGLKAGATTSTQAIMGTPRYMSPEQVSSSKHVDGRTDVWAMGLILYELLTHAFPFEGDTVGAILSNILTSDVVPPSELRADIPRGLEAVVMKCLKRDREDRFDNARAMMCQLAPYGSIRVRTRVLKPSELRGPSAATATLGTPKGALSLSNQAPSDAGPIPASTLHDEVTLSHSERREGSTQTNMELDDSIDRRRSNRRRAVVLVAGAAAALIGGWWAFQSSGDGGQATPSATAVAEASVQPSSAAPDVSAGLTAAAIAATQDDAPSPSSSGEHALEPSSKPTSEPAPNTASIRRPPTPVRPRPPTAARPTPVTPAPQPDDILGSRN